MLGADNASGCSKPDRCVSTLFFSKHIKAAVCIKWSFDRITVCCEIECLVQIASGGSRPDL